MKNTVKKTSALIILLLVAFNAFSTVYTTVADGNWNNQSVWSPSKPVLNWSFNDTIVVNNNIVLSSGLNLYGRMTVAQGASLTGSNTTFYVRGGAELLNNGTISVKTFRDDWGSADVVNNGSLSVANNFYFYNGNFTNSALMSVGASLNIFYSAVFTNAQNAVLTVGNTLSNKNDFTNNGDLTVSKDLKNSWSASFVNTGNVQVAKQLRNQGSINNSGTMTSGKKWINDWGTVLINSGTVTVNNDFTNRGTLTNSGTLNVSQTFTNKGSLDNSNTVNVNTDMYNTYGNVTNTGVINVVNNLYNLGQMLNNGGMFVDGFVSSSSGTISGSGNLCNSDGVTDPTGGSKSVTCAICAGEGSTLPVSLIDFGADINGNNVTLHWISATEINNDYYEVLRSVNGIDYQPVARVKGAGNSNVEIDYSLSDNLPGAGVYYYVLKQVDYDGTSTLSKALSVVVENNDLSARLYPNPVRAGDALIVETNSVEKKRVEIYNVAGQLVRGLDVFDERISVDTSGLTKGIYIVRIIRNTNIISKKIRID